LMRDLSGRLKHHLAEADSTGLRLAWPLCS
jgi:hypothetical protein